MNKLFSKIVSAVTAAVMTLFVSSNSLQTFVNEIDAHAAETDVILGDVNHDDRVDPSKDGSELSRLNLGLNLQ